MTLTYWSLPNHGTSHMNFSYIAVLKEVCPDGYLYKHSACDDRTDGGTVIVYRATVSLSIVKKDIIRSCEYMDIVVCQDKQSRSADSNLSS